MNIGKLVASDFPGIDKAKFNEWKALHLEFTRRLRIVSYFALPIGLILYPIIRGKEWTLRGIIIDWSAVLLVIGSIFIVGSGFYLRPINRRFRQLDSELKMSARLRAKQKGNS